MQRDLMAEAPSIIDRLVALRRKLTAMESAPEDAGAASAKPLAMGFRNFQNWDQWNDWRNWNNPTPPRP
jgi:hypothetical protein